MITSPSLRRLVKERKTNPFGRGHGGELLAPCDATLTLMLSRGVPSRPLAIRTVLSATSGASARGGKTKKL